MRRFEFARVLRLGGSLVAASSLWLAAGHFGCSEKTTLGSVGTPCDTDEQCATDPARPISCKCVRMR